MSRFGDSHGLFAGRINQTTSPERTPSVAAKPVVTELAKSFGHSSWAACSKTELLTSSAT